MGEMVNQLQRAAARGTPLVGKEEEEGEPRNMSGRASGMMVRCAPPTTK